MKRSIFLIIASLTLLVAGVASAQDNTARHASGGLGFHSGEAPLGLRWWMGSQKMAIDFGVGFNSVPATLDPDETETSWAIEAGLPIVMHSWEGVHVLFRPGILYQSDDVGFDSDLVTPGIQFDTDQATSISALAEIEGEVFLRDNISVSASTGFRFSSFEPPFDGDSSTSFGLFGRNFTDIGFHVYFLGAK